MSATDEHLEYATQFRPRVRPSGDAVLVDWRGIHDRILATARARGDSNPHDLEVSVYVNGVEAIAHLGFACTEVRLEQVPGKQYDYYVVHRRAGAVVDISEFALLESHGDHLVPRACFEGPFTGECFALRFDASVRGAGVSERLTRTAVDLGYHKVVWILKPTAEARVRAFIRAAGQGVDVHVQIGADGRPDGAVVTDRRQGTTLECDAANFFVKVDAAFSSHAFFWDDMLVAVATVPHHPWLAASTIEFWLLVQDLNGGVIPREVRKENLLSLWFAESVTYGARPRPNLSYTNPYLMNWAMDVLWRFEPAYVDLLERVCQSIDRYAAWMESNRAVLDDDGAIVGFNGSALGSGADNGRGEIGNRAEANAYETAFVDFLSHHVAMFKDQARWHVALGRARPAARARAKARRFERLLNERYWNEERGFYFDLEPVGENVWRQNHAFVPITGFWALYAGAASPAQVARLDQKQLHARAFGGDFPFPANALEVIDGSRPRTYRPRTPEHREDGYWDKWARWPSMAMVATEGLRRCGRPDLAHQLAVRYLAKMAEWSSDTVEENYGVLRVKRSDGSVRKRARVGRHARHQRRPDFAGWGKGPPIYLGLVDVLGLDVGADGVVTVDVRVNCAVGDGFGVEYLRLAGAVVEELRLTRVAEDVWRLDARADRPFRLRLRTLRDRRGVLHASPRAAAPTVDVGGEVASVELRLVDAE